MITPRQAREVDGALLVYHRLTAPGFRDASTIWEHIGAFTRYSQFPVWAVNSDYGFPHGLQHVRPKAILLHYSILGNANELGDEFSEFIASSDAYKVAFFQDEYHNCGRRFRFIDDLGIDCVYSLLPPEHFDEVYGRYTKAREVRHNLPGYVSQEMLEDASSFAIPDEQRPIDIGYRSRQLPGYMGKGGAEKFAIGEGFLERASGTDLVVDIDSSLEARLYGKAWPEFIARCKAVLGVESGVSVFDLEEEVSNEDQRLRNAGIELSADEWEAGPLSRWYGKIHYRTISPRHFEAAAMRTCQVLFEGEYSGAMKPMVHYIPLKKDFSNFDEVVERVRDPALRRELTDNAHRDLIASGKYGYDQLIADIDRTLAAAGVRSEATSSQIAAMDAALRRGSLYRRMRKRLRWTVDQVLARVFRVTTPLMRPIRRILGRPARTDRVY